MKSWLLLLSGLLIWAAHFFGIYIIGSVFPGTDTARWLVAALTLVCLGAAVLVLSRFLFGKRGAHDHADRWVRSLGLLGCRLAIPALVFQALPAILT